MIEQFVIVSFAVYCLTSLLTEEIGPFFIFLKLRWLVGIQYLDQDGKFIRFEHLVKEIYQTGGFINSQIYFRNALALALSCFKCISVWVSLVAVLVLLQPQDIVQFITLTLAVSGGARLIEALIDRG